MYITHAVGSEPLSLSVEHPAIFQYHTLYISIMYTRVVWLSRVWDVRAAPQSLDAACAIHICVGVGVRANTPAVITYIHTGSFIPPRTQYGPGILAVPDVLT